MEPLESSSGSIFDEIDKNPEYQIKEKYEKKSTDFYYFLFHYAQQKANMGLEECLSINFFEFIEFLEFMTRVIERSD